MPPKAAKAPAAEPVLPKVPEVPEEDEEGEGRATFRIAVGGVSDLPRPLQTVLVFSGICRANQSSPAPASENPADFELPKDKFIRRQCQDLYNDLVSKDFVITLRDAGSDGAEIGRASMNCLPLLHDELEVSGELEVKLTEAYYKKWWPDLEDAQVDPKAKAKAKAKAAPAPEPEVADKPKRPEGFVPPATKIVVTLRVDSLVGPAEDREDWTTLTIGLAGAFSLPGRLTAGAAEDFEAHPFTYKAFVFGEDFAEGTLAKPKEEAPVAEEGKGGEAPGEEPAEEALSEEVRQIREERFGMWVKFGEGKPLVRYRGKEFLKEFRFMLNYTGGVWLYFSIEEKPSSDPKKPNPPETAALAKHFEGKAWVDLRSLIRPGSCLVEGRFALTGAALPKDTLPEEGSLEDARTFVSLSFGLRSSAAPPPEPPIGDLRSLVPPRAPMNRFPGSADAATMYREVVEATFHAMCKDCSANTESVVSAVEQLKKAGTYDDLRETLRGAVIRVFRERLRKDTSATPGRRLEGKARDELLADGYAHLKDTAAKVLDELRSKGGADYAVDEGGDVYMSEAPDAGGFGDGDAESAQFGDGASVVTGIPSIVPSVVPSAVVSLAAATAAPKHLDPATLLAESAAARRARGAVTAATEVNERNGRLAYEAELVGNWSRAAELLQGRLLLDEVRSDPKEWVAYAKFCARARGRQAAAEEALRQAVQLLAQGEAANAEDAIEIDTMLACLLLDRGRHEEATRVLRELHEKDIADPTANFLLGLALFLADESPKLAMALFKAAGKPYSWFTGVKNDRDIEEKLKASKGGDIDVAPYAACLEKLLDFGLPGLAFTFLDQTKVLPSDALAREPLALIDAKASAIDRDHAAAVARLERLTGDVGSAARASASQEAWQLLGDCFFHMGDMDRALLALNNALSFEKRFEEPDVYVRLGSVLIAKKRWKQAREAFLKSIQFRPTAEAWFGVAYAEHRSDEALPCYEALREAALLDNERSDIWALLTLVHLRQENATQADHHFRQCLSLKADGEELLLEVATEFARGAMSCRNPTFAEAAARRALQLRHSGAGHAALADAFAAQGRLGEACEEAELAIGLLVHNPELRGAVFERASRWAEESGARERSESLNSAQRRSDEEALRSSAPPS